MSRIDDELEQAVRDAEASKPQSAASGQAAAAARDEAVPVVGEAQAEPKMRWGLLGALLVLMGGILTLVFSGGKDAVAYSYTVDEVKAKAGELGDRQLRVQGGLVEGTLVRRDSPCEYRFMIRKLEKDGKLDTTGQALEVRYPLCVVPDTFRDKAGVEVTAEGRLAADGHLQASKIFAKCPSKYDPSTHQVNDNAKVGSERPRQDIIPASTGVR
jgi:cytochrome c-type biogenesis protein CcmE